MFAMSCPRGHICSIFEVVTPQCVYVCTSGEAVMATITSAPKKFHPKVRNHGEGPSSSRFQPGEGPSRGLLRDYEPSDSLRLKH